jgi:hypothetical protein
MFPFHENNRNSHLDIPTRNVRVFNFFDSYRTFLVDVCLVSFTLKLISNHVACLIMLVKEHGGGGGISPIETYLQDLLSFAYSLSC